MNPVQCRPVPFKFQLGDLTLFGISRCLQVRTESLLEPATPPGAPLPPDDGLADGSEGFLIRGLPVGQDLPVISRVGAYLRYVPLQYEHCYVDLGQSFEAYGKKFSSKTRSTIRRKVRKYAEHSGGTIAWQAYTGPEDMDAFFRHAREVSKKTYQERLLDAGLPDSEEFARRARALAGEDRVRAFILFDGSRPVSYLYCPVREEVLIYAYLGYDPEYAHMSVGTVLQWLALEYLFDEGRFRYFDFTEGQSEHKRLYATHQRRCANVFFLRRTWRNTALVYGHRLADRISHWLGERLERFGLKTRIRRMLRVAK